MSARGDKTREHLLDVAERLLGDHGVERTSLREIRLAAGARNTAAMQYHFGDREGLLEALTERHMPRIAEMQTEVLERVTRAGSSADPRGLVEVLVGPLASYIGLGSSERSWIKIMADLAASPDLHLNEMVAVTPEAGIKAGRALSILMAETLPPEIVRERVVLVAQASVHLCADYARMVDNPTESRRHLPQGAFAENLVDMMTSALLADVSSFTATAFDAEHSTT